MVAAIYGGREDNYTFCWGGKILGQAQAGGEHGRQKIKWQQEKPRQKIREKDN